MREFYAESLMQQLFSLKTFEELTKKKFDAETQIFIPEILGDMGEASALDFVSHAPSGKDLEIFCLMSHSQRVTNVIKSSGNRSLTIYRLANINDQELTPEDRSEEELRLKFIADSLKSINQAQFTSIYDKKL